MPTGEKPGGGRSVAGAGTEGMKEVEREEALCRKSLSLVAKVGHYTDFCDEAVYTLILNGTNRLYFSFRA